MLFSKEAYKVAVDRTVHGQFCQKLLGNPVIRLNDVDNGGRVADDIDVAVSHPQLRKACRTECRTDFAALSIYQGNFQDIAQNIAPEF